MKIKLHYSAVVLIFASSLSLAQSPVNIVGEMKQVMWKGELFAKIQLDTITNKSNLYGLGPLENLSGELMIIDGKSYKSTVVSDTDMKVEETFIAGAPFFGYANIPNWTSQKLPADIHTLADLEEFLEKQTAIDAAPYFFKLTGTVDKAIIHIVNLAPGSIVRSPDEAHQGQVNYPLHDQSFEILGFFSRNHRAVFTHHDTFVHMHLMTADLQKMGHLDEAQFKKGSLVLHLPAR